MDHVRFITHQGKRILLIDLANCSAEEVMKIVGEVQRMVTAQPPKSVFTLSDLTGTVQPRCGYPNEGSCCVRQAVCEARSHGWR